MLLKEFKASSIDFSNNIIEHHLTLRKNKIQQKHLLKRRQHITEDKTKHKIINIIHHLIINPIGTHLSSLKELFTIMNINEDIYSIIIDNEFINVVTKYINHYTQIELNATTQNELLLLFIIIGHLSINYYTFKINIIQKGIIQFIENTNLYVNNTSPYFWILSILFDGINFFNTNHNKNLLKIVINIIYKCNDNIHQYYLTQQTNNENIIYDCVQLLLLVLYSNISFSLLYINNDILINIFNLLLLPNTYYIKDISEIILITFNYLINNDEAYSLIHSLITQKQFVYLIKDILLLMNQHKHKMSKIINLLLSIIYSLIDYEELCEFVVECLPLLDMLIQLSGYKESFKYVFDIVCCLCLDENEKSVRCLVMCGNVCEFFIHALRMVNRGSCYGVECMEEKLYNSMYVIINYLAVNSEKLKLFMNKIELAGGRDIIENEMNKYINNNNSLLYEKVNYIFNSFSFDISESSSDSSMEQEYN